MYPQPAYPGCSWPLNHHIVKVTSRELYYFLLTAAGNSDAPAPSLNINQIMSANGILTSNVRQDSGQPETWRDYQQILSQLGLIFSTRAQRSITPTPLGQAYLDGMFGFSEVITLQAFRYQYPNGHNLQISSGLIEALQGTPYATVRPFSRLQQQAGVQLRPAVLIWRVLRQLQLRGEQAQISVEDIDTYLMRCVTHSDTDACVNALISSRQGSVSLPPLSQTRLATRRDAQEWCRLLLKTPLFTGDGNALRISSYGSQCATDVDSMCDDLEQPSSFWAPATFDINDAKSWYAWFGSVDIGVSSIPPVSTDDSEEELKEFQDGREDDDERGADVISSAGGQIQLREFDPASFLSLDREVRSEGGTTIESSYDAALSNRAHRLHDQMVILIGNTCRAKGAIVRDDPDTLDLLAEFQNVEFLIEVKSATPRNFVKRVRYALGQVIHYDYLRSTQSDLPRRKVIAVAARVPQSSWCVPFLNTYLDIDLLSLEGQNLRVTSNMPLAQQLFASL